MMSITIMKRAKGVIFLLGIVVFDPLTSWKIIRLKAGNTADEWFRLSTGTYNLSKKVPLKYAGKGTLMTPELHIIST